MNEERLKELMTLWEQGIGISNEEMAEVFAAARRCNELEAALDLNGKRVEWEAEQHAKKCVELEDMKAERDAFKETVKELEIRCNELEAENAALKDVNWDISYPDGESLATLKAERDTLRANNAALREALENVLKDIKDYETINNLSPSPGKDYCWQSVERACKTLASTPADSLREYRNGVIEEVCSQVEKEWPSSKVLVTIRAMKETDNDTN